MLKSVFYVSLFSLVLGQFTAVHKSAGLNIYFFDLAIVFFVLYGVFYLLIKKKFNLPIYLNIFYLFIFLATFSLLFNSYLLSFSQFAVAAFYLIRLVFYLLAGLLVFNMLKQHIITQKELVFSIILSGLVLSFFGFAQLLLLPDFEALDPLLGWDPHKNRLASTFFDPNFTGGYLSICLAFVLHFLFYIKQKFTTFIKAFVLFSGFIIALALLLTFSRSAWLFVAVVVFTFGLFKARYLLYIAVLIAFLAYFTVPRVQSRLVGITDPADSAHFRVISWQNTLTIAQDNLWIGVGFNAYRFAQAKYGFFEAGTLGGHSGSGSDSSLLLILATTGVFGFVVFIFACFFPLVDILFKPNEYKTLLFSVLLGLFVQSQFINAIFFPQILFLLVAVLALTSYSREHM